MRKLLPWVAGLFAACNAPSPPGSVTQEVGGAQLYAKLCASCHAPDGRSLAAVAPPLAGHAVRILEAAGRGHLIRIVLNGMSGPIEVGGRRYDAMMTPLRYLKDQQVADVLNHILSSWGNDKLRPPDAEPITAEEVRKERVPISSPQEMASRRPQLSRPAEESSKR